MVQTYGVANEHGEEVIPDANMSAESDALLGGEASARKPKAEGHATLQSSVGNLANTIIGSGEHPDLLYECVHSLTNVFLNPTGMLTFPLVRPEHPMNSACG